MTTSVLDSQKHESARNVGRMPRGRLTRTARRPHAMAGRAAKWAGVAPAVVLIGAVAGIAIVQAIVISLTKWRGIGPLKLVGIENYQALLGNPATYESLRTTFLYASLSTVGILVVATVLAAAVSAGMPGSRVYRVIWFLPGIAPGAAVAIFWATAFQPRFGAINAIASFFGGDGLSALLADPSTAIIPVIVVTVWAGVGFAFLLLLGSMEQISPSLYEAARVDGASGLRQFFAITLPLARPVIVITAMLNFIWAFNGFTIVWAMTRGGPGTSTNTLPVLVYKTAFSFADYGPAAALAVFGSAILIVVGVVGIRLSRSAQ